MKSKLQCKNLIFQTSKQSNQNFWISFKNIDLNENDNQRKEINSCENRDDMHSQYKLIDEDFFLLSEKFDKIKSTNKILKEELSKKYADILESEIKNYTRDIKNNFCCYKFENYFKFFKILRQKLGFFVFTKKTIKISKIIMHHFIKNLEKGNYSDVNINNMYIDFLQYAKNDECFRFVLEKEFNINQQKLIEIFHSISSVNSEVYERLKKAKKTKKNKKINIKSKIRKIQNLNNKSIFQRISNEDK